MLLPINVSVTVPQLRRLLEEPRLFHVSRNMFPQFLVSFFHTSYVGETKMQGKETGVLLNMEEDQ